MCGKETRPGSICSPPPKAAHSGCDWGRGTRRVRSPAHQRASAVLQRPKSFRRRDRGTEIVEVARIFGLRGLLGLEQVGIVNLAAVGADGAFAEEGVIGFRPF